MHFTKISTCKNTFFFYTIPFPIIFFIFFLEKGRKLKFIPTCFKLYFRLKYSLFFYISVIYIKFPLNGLLTRGFEILYYTIQNKLQNFIFSP